MGLIKIILIIALVYYGLKIISRIFAPYILRFAAKKAEERFKDRFQNHSKADGEDKKKEGDITIDKIPKKKPTNKNVGEYVDFEEVE